MESATDCTPRCWLTRTRQGKPAERQARIHDQPRSSARNGTLSHVNDTRGCRVSRNSETSPLITKSADSGRLSTKVYHLVKGRSPPLVVLIDRVRLEHADVPDPCGPPPRCPTRTSTRVPYGTDPRRLLLLTEWNECRSPHGQLVWLVGATFTAGTTSWTTDAGRRPTRTSGSRPGMRLAVIDSAVRTRTGGR